MSVFYIVFSIFLFVSRPVPSWQVPWPPPLSRPPHLPLAVSAASVQASDHYPYFPSFRGQEDQPKVQLTEKSEGSNTWMLKHYTQTQQYVGKNPATNISADTQTKNEESACKCWNVSLIMGIISPTDKWQREVNNTMSLKKKKIFRLLNQGC